MSSRRHDRHGRATRADNTRQRRPPDGFRATHGARFSDLVKNAIAELPPILLEGMSGINVVIETIPPVDDETIAKGEVPLVRLTNPIGGAGGASSVAKEAEDRRLVVYRRPLELRATSHGELIEIIRTAIGGEIARFLGIEDIDDLFDED
jgi:predicted Zn-dependent protease with MMP-like domain